MSTSKTQAQKRQDRDERNKRNAEERALIQNAKAEAFRQQRLNEKREEDIAKLDKKALKKAQKNAKKKGAGVTEPKLEIIAVSELDNVSVVEEKSSRTEATIASEAPSGTKNSSYSVIMAACNHSDSFSSSTPLSGRNSEMNTDVTTDPKPISFSRLVENDSMYCDGLKTVLFRLKKVLPPGCIIIPGKLSREVTNCQTLDLIFQHTEGNTHMFVARKGTTIQDVNIVVPNIDTELYTAEAICECIQDVLFDSFEKAPRPASTKVSLSSFNRAIGLAEPTLWKAEAQAAHIRLKEQEQEQKKQVRVDRQFGKLANKGLLRETARAHAERDAAIISGELRTNHSCR